MRNLLASALVALLVSVAASSANQPPALHDISTAALSRTSAPSDSQRIDALITRVDRLQRKLNDTTQTADDAASITACLTGGLWMTNNPDTQAWTNGDGTEPDAVVIPTLDSSCAVPA